MATLGAKLVGATSSSPLFSLILDSFSVLSALASLTSVSWVGLELLIISDASRSSGFPSSGISAFDFTSGVTSDDWALAYAANFEACLEA